MTRPVVAGFNLAGDILCEAAVKAEAVLSRRQLLQMPPGPECIEAFHGGDIYGCVLITGPILKPPRIHQLHQNRLVL